MKRHKLIFYMGILVKTYNKALINKIIKNFNLQNQKYPKINNILTQSQNISKHSQTSLNQNYSTLVSSNH